jgi:DMSO/TMAO reductase YedYZ heme-binding membrane subunit
VTPLVLANAKTLWFVTRGSGVVALILLTCAMLLGVTLGLRARSSRWPRFAFADLHRNLTLLAIVFVTVHVVTTITDGYAPISVVATFVPFESSYRPVWLGLGAIAFDLLLALVVTSLLRHRMSARLWRAVHWVAYLTWPVALVHSFGTGSDARFGWLASLGFASLAIVALAVLVRAGLGAGPSHIRLAAAAGAVAAPILVFLWYQSGPSQHGWAKRAGTPATVLAKGARLAPSAGNVSLVRPAAPPTSFASALAGTERELQGADGLVTVRLTLHLRGGPRGAARIDLRGIPSGEGGSLTASGVSFVPATTRSVYTGQVVGLDGQHVAADVRDGAGHELRLDFRLSIDSRSHTVTGVVATRGDGE